MTALRQTRPTALTPSCTINRSDYHSPRQLTQPNPAGAGGATQAKLRSLLNSQFKRIPKCSRLSSFISIVLACRCFCDARNHAPSWNSSSVPSHFVARSFVPLFVPVDQFRLSDQRDGRTKNTRGTNSRRRSRTIARRNCPFKSIHQVWTMARDWIRLGQI